MRSVSAKTHHGRGMGFLEIGGQNTRSSPVWAGGWQHEVLTRQFTNYFKHEKWQSPMPSLTSYGKR
jgi:hypothetical protein